MATIEVKHALVSYIVCGDRVEARVRTYGNGRALEEASVVFSEKDLLARNAAWTEKDIMAVVGCDCWITDIAGQALTADITANEPSILDAPRFADVAGPTGSLLAGLVAEQKKA